MINIHKPKSEIRDIKGGILSNKIKFVLIHDQYLTKSYITVSINSGSYSNPKDYEGLAHFLEHMLFMGSSKYPNENYFMEKVNEYGGYTNAYTAEFITTYYFNVFDNGLELCLDIFSQFFINPLFNIDSINREINAVDNEHKKNLNNDDFKMHQFKLYLANKSSPINTFITGSLETLNKNDLRNKMIEFYNNYYVSNNISICIASSKFIDDLYSLIKTYFEIIPIKSKINFSIQKPFYSSNIKKIYYIETSNMIYRLIYLWEIPCNNLNDKLCNDFIEIPCNNLNDKLCNDFKQINQNDFNHFDFLSFLIKNKCYKSLYYKLKNKGLLIKINIDLFDEGIFQLELFLTSKGYKNIKYINNILFSYLKNIYNLNLCEYAKYYNKITNIQYNINNKIDTNFLCNIFASNHFKYDTNNIFKNIFVYDNIKSSEYYKTLFEKYINNNNYIIIIASKNNIYKNVEYNKLYQYNTNYGEIKNFQIFDNKIKFTNKFNFINLDNKYLNLFANYNINNDNNINFPILLNNTTNITWYGSFFIYNEPIINIWIQFYNIKYYNTPKNYILTHLCYKILNFIINIKFNELFNINYSIYFVTDIVHSSININISGPNDVSKFKLLLNDISNLIININKKSHILSLELIDSIILELKNNLKNIKYSTSWKLDDIIFQQDILLFDYNIKILLKTLNNISYDEIYKYLYNIFNHVAITNFIYGYINNNDIIILNNELCNNFNSYSIQKHDFHLIKNKKLYNKVIIHSYKKEISNCVSFYFKIGKFNPIKYLLIKLCINIFSNKFFDLLRTKYQFGYLVSMNYKLINNDYYIYQKVQSTQSIKNIINKINEFNKSLLTQLNNININTFLVTLKNEINIKDNNLNEIYSRYLYEISSRNFIFNRKELLLDNINNINIILLQKFIKKYINKSNKVTRIIQKQ